MNNKTKRILSAISALAIIGGISPIQPVYDVISNCAITANAEAEWFGNFQFDTETGTITAYRGTDTNVEIPSKIGGINVTTIGTSAFKDNQSIENVKIPSTVTVLGNQAFQNCQSLISVEMSPEITIIGVFAFSSCTSLKSITIPAAVTIIGAYVFEKCSSLESVKFEPNSKLESIDGECTFYLCSSLKEIELPEGLISIGNGAFESDISLTSIRIPSSVSSIGNKAFNGCSNLKDVMFAPNSQLSYIYSNTFAGCEALENLTLPDNLIDIGNYAFYGCKSLVNLKLPDTLTAVYQSSFAYCSSLKNITIPKSLTYIAYCAFEHTYNITNIFYDGTEKDWEKIEISNAYNANDSFINTPVIYNARYVKSAALVLDGTLKVDILFNGEIDEKGGYTINGKNFSTKDKIYTVEVAAKEFLNNITLEYNGEIMQTFSVADMLETYKKTDATKNIASAVEEYCTAAKAYFSGEKVKDYSASYSDIKTAIGGHSVNMGKNYYGSSLLLKSGTILRHYYKSNVANSTKKGNYYIIDETIPAHLFSNNENYCVNDYIYNVLSNKKTDANLKNLCAAIYFYGTAAKAYRP